MRRVRDNLRESMDDYNAARWLWRYNQRRSVNWWGVTSLLMVAFCALFSGYLLTHLVLFLWRHYGPGS